MGMIERIYGRDGIHSSMYLFRVKLTPRTPWGQFYLHIFNRGDLDRAPHDHPWSFWTFPLVGYTEETWTVIRALSGATMICCNHTAKVVRPWRFHYRPAEYIHRVNDPAAGKKIVTLVWHCPKSREWGFWVDGTWVPWRDYVYNGESNGHLTQDQ